MANAVKKKDVKRRIKKAAPVTLEQIKAALIGDIGAEILRANKMTDLIEFELFCSHKTATIIAAYDKQQEEKGL